MVFIVIWESSVNHCWSTYKKKDGVHSLSCTAKFFIASAAKLRFASELNIQLCNWAGCLKRNFTKYKNMKIFKDEIFRTIFEKKKNNL